MTCRKSCLRRPSRSRPSPSSSTLTATTRESAWRGSGTGTICARGWRRDGTARAERCRRGAPRGGGLRSVPRPLAADAARRAALYEYVDGRRTAEADMDAEHVLECAGLFAALNTPAARSAAGELPDASDACFSVVQHMRSVDRRLERLASISAGGAADREAAQLVALIAARWQGERAALLRAMPDAKYSIDERCVSPSDFGFHNALVRADGRLCFLDFEYAGWDDPAKMAGDFFWHAGMRPPRRHFEAFVQAAFAGLIDPQASATRTRMLFPVFRARWACIALNEFLPDAMRRRQFAGGAAEDLEARKRVQLQKAQAVYADADS